MNESLYHKRKWDLKASANKRSAMFIDELHDSRMYSAKYEIEKIKSELIINLDDRLTKYIEHSYYNNLNLEMGEIYNTLRFIREVYVSIFGSQEGLDDFIYQRRELIYTNFNIVKYRLVILNHFGFLKEGFIEQTNLITSDFTLVSTKDFYRLFNLGVIKDLNDFVTIAKRLSKEELENLRAVYKVDRELLTNLNEEMKIALLALKKKSVFLYNMRKRRQ